MAKEFFRYPETAPLFKQLETISQRSGVSRAAAFEDFLTATVCCLAAETMEDEYMAMVERHKEGKPGRRGIDLMPEMFAALVHAMDGTRDVLGDLFEGSISYGEAGQILTPESVTRLLAELSVDVPAERNDDDRQTRLINDPCCGTGRMLLEASERDPDAELVGQDIDARCAKITAVNVGLRHKYGWVVCGNTLTGEAQFAYRVAPFFHEGPNGTRRGVVRSVPPEQTPVPVIARRAEIATASLENDGAEQETTRDGIPKIIEIPRYVLRLEAATATNESEQADDGPDEVKALSNHAETLDLDQRVDDESPKDQKWLF